MKQPFFIFFSLILIASACKTTQTVTTTAPTTVSSLIDTSSVLSQSFSGLVLYDLEKKQTVYDFNGNRYFTPASNTKLYTFYACLKSLKDSIPALRYVTKGDSLIFWGTGDPSFLHPDFKNDTIVKFLKAQNGKKLFWSVGNFKSEYYGSGWAWDDYNDAYQTELTPLPMYGNVVRFNVTNKILSSYPPFLKDSVVQTPLDKGEIKRDIERNIFNTPQYILQKNTYNQEIPLKTSIERTQKMLSDTLKKAVNVLNLPVLKDAKTLYSMPLQPIYRQMLEISDNMLAEQLLLSCGAALKDSINTNFAISEVKNRFLNDLPDAPKWVDGSGLSRYNLFTPRSTVKLLEKIYAEMPQAQLFAILPTGGQGTLSGYYTSATPYIFAKSGSLTGVYNLSGYLKTARGRLLLFSFMNNNFNKSTSTIRREVERVLTWVHLNY